MRVPKEEQRSFLLNIARREMVQRNLVPDFSPEALAEAARVPEETAPAATGKNVRDLTEPLWCSIDNDDSLDLDQLTVAEHLDGENVRILVAVADVSGVVPTNSAIDRHAGINTTSVYTPPGNFPMLPDRLSTDLTSLVQDKTRMAIVIDMIIDGQGEVVGESSVYAAAVMNKAKLAYSGVAAWLEGAAAMPARVAAVAGLAENIQLQDRVAHRLRSLRHLHGALDLETTETRTRFDGDSLSGLAAVGPDRAHELIEDFMIAANGAVAHFLESARFPVIRRVVRTPERWDRIVALAQELGERLPDQPDPKALDDFLVRRRQADPVRFPDLSLAVIKLLGRGEYMAAAPNQEIPGHFGLAVSDYTHSTAPNRRYPDLITQRLLKAALAGTQPPYQPAQLESLALFCTNREDDARKVERSVRKSAAALLLEDSIGQEFRGIVTGASPKGTWARIFNPPVEGRIEQGASGLEVGDLVRVRLTHTDPDRGFIDFACTGHTAVGRG